jgi:aminoglycoside phosphotransferase family enzyme/predicted kinase
VSDFGAQQELVDFLIAQEDGPCDIVETHISIVVLGADRAYKLKKPVRFPYLDFSTPELRLEMCRREAALNRLYAPELYLGVSRITRESDQTLAVNGAGALVDSVVEMRRFPDDMLFDRMVREARLTRDMIERLAQRIASFHDAAAPDYQRGGALALQRSLDLAIEALHLSELAPRAEISALAEKLTGSFLSNMALMESRRQAGAVRLCHGDLTLRNICLYEGMPTPFDCLEFSDDIATIDVLYDLAFLLMDLWRSDAPNFANIAFNRYLDLRDEMNGVALLPFFQSFRATIRAHVEASQGHQEVARDYMNLAQSLLAPPLPKLIAIGGFSGAGKSSLAAVLAPRLGVAPGARILNTDRIRKQMFNVSPTAPLPADAYAPEVSQQVYRRLLAAARQTLARGWPVIVDAVFDRQADREEIETLACQLDVPFQGLWLDVGLEIRAARVDQRVHDVSDATRDVLTLQMEKSTGEIGWRRLDATRDALTLATEIH